MSSNTRLNHTTVIDIQRRFSDLLTLRVLSKPFPITVTEMRHLVYSPQDIAAASAIPHLVTPTNRLQFSVDVTVSTGATQRKTYQYMSPAVVGAPRAFFAPGRTGDIFHIAEDRHNPVYVKLQAWCQWLYIVNYETAKFKNELDTMLMWANSTGQMLRVWPKAATFIPNHALPAPTAPKSRLPIRLYPGDPTLFSLINKQIEVCTLLENAIPRTERAKHAPPCAMY